MEDIVKTLHANDIFLSYAAAAYFRKGKLINMVSSNKKWQSLWKDKKLYQDDPCVILGQESCYAYMPWEFLSPCEKILSLRKELCAIERGITFFTRFEEHLFLVAAGWDHTESQNIHLDNLFSILNKRAIKHVIACEK